MKTKHELGGTYPINGKYYTVEKGGCKDCYFSLMFIKDCVDIGCGEHGGCYKQVTKTLDKI